MDWITGIQNAINYYCELWLPIMKNNMTPEGFLRGLSIAKDYDLPDEKRCNGRNCLWRGFTAESDPDIVESSKNYHVGLCFLIKTPFSVDTVLYKLYNTKCLISKRIWR